MRICLMANAWSLHTKRWATFFQKSGHEVHIISKGGFGGDPVEGAVLHVIEKVREKPGLISDILNYRHLTSQVKSIIKDIEPDIVNAHYISIYGVLAASTGFHPYVATVWGSDVLQDTKRSNRIRISVKKALGSADRITLASDFLKEYLITNLGVPETRITKVPWGVDLSIFHRGYEEEVKTFRSGLDIDPASHIVISSRSAHPIYNIESIVKAIPFVMEERDDVIFIILQGFAEPDHMARLESMIRALEVYDNVRIIRNVLTPREMAILNNSAEVFLSIPKSDQFGLTIFEGMACGPIPVVSNIPTYKQYLEHERNALFIDPDRPQEISEAILQSISDESLREHFFEENSRIVRQNENWELNAKKMESLFENLIIDRE
jgi:glycosyltransferase involved in cell wall biosynthesis